MAYKLNDPLLTVARLIVTIAQTLMVIGGLVLLIGIPLVTLLRDRIEQEVRIEYVDPTLQLPLPALVALMLLGVVIVALAWFFLRNLRRIIDTVGDGDPFVPVNARRLTGMAWLMLAIQGLMIVLGALAIFIVTSLQEPIAQADIDIDLSGVVLVVTLFILARVFRLGAAMRDDLEGTV